MPADTLNSYNLPFLEAMYEQYVADPQSVDPRWRSVLEANAVVKNGHARPSAAIPADSEQAVLQAAVARLIEQYRLHGHLGADIDPLGLRERHGAEALEPGYHGLTEAHLDRSFDAEGMFGDEGPRPLREILERLRNTYAGHVGVEYWHVPDLERRRWLQQRMEACQNQVVPPEDEQRTLLRSLASCDNVDRFLHTKFIGAKRFSVSGGESVITMLETLIEDAAERDVTECVFGMAHRGRLNVLMNIMGRTPLDIFSEFEKGDPWRNLGSGDVKYHKGSYREYTARNGRSMYLALAFNPSHLEAISPVVSGRVRAKQDLLPAEQRNQILGVTLHGDGAFAGQGVVSETLNLSRLEGYSTEGTIRIVINNQVGFTTNPSEARSMQYCTGVAHMLKVPIFHVNGDDPEAAAYVARLALAYRQEFASDVIIDLCCYRRFGHNEGDEPTFTQPQMYERIKRHPSVRAMYQQRLIERGTISAAACDEMDAELHSEFEDALASVRREGPDRTKSPMHGIWSRYVGGPDSEVPEADTRIGADTIEAIRGTVTHVPDGFNIHRKLKRLLGQSDEMLAGNAPLDWANAEYLAYGSLLRAGHSIRISGQDCVRGTFGHRHAGWTDTQTGARHFPLANTPTAEATTERGRFDVYNSPLSEFAVVGFEYGYSLAAPGSLLIWEAQFGDFANGAQVMIDQFLSSSEDKWNRVSGLTLLLPHGYEGQGPEHSSARLERFLQLCAEDNMQVCMVSTPAQLFHVLRRQVLRPWRKPLVMMMPKSPLRDRRCFSPLAEFTDGAFARVIDDPTTTPENVKHLLLCSGKIYFDLVDEREKRERSDVAIIRVEQLYPFPEQGITEALRRYPNVELVRWVQEEPQNMGCWTFVSERIRSIMARLNAQLELDYAGREASASPATGLIESHRLECELVLEEAFKTNKRPRHGN